MPLSKTATIELNAVLFLKIRKKRLKEHVRRLMSSQVTTVQNYWAGPKGLERGNLYVVPYFQRDSSHTTEAGSVTQNTGTCIYIN